MTRVPREQPYDQILRFIFLGDSGVGKSSLLLRFTQDKFKPSFMATIGVDYSEKVIDIKDKKIKLLIWDTAGQERFQSLSKAYYRGCRGILLVYDVTQRETFENIHRWMGTLRSQAHESAEIFLVGNKSDDMENREVSIDEGKALAVQLNVPFVETSAKSSLNVDACFRELAMMLRQKGLNQLAPAPQSLSKSQTVDLFTHTMKNNCCWGKRAIRFCQFKVLVDGSIFEIEYMELLETYSVDLFWIRGYLFLLLFRLITSRSSWIAAIYRPQVKKKVEKKNKHLKEYIEKRIHENNTSSPNQPFPQFPLSSPHSHIKSSPESHEKCVRSTYLSHTTPPGHHPGQNRQAAPPKPIPRHIFINFFSFKTTLISRCPFGTGSAADSPCSSSCCT